MITLADRIRGCFVGVALGDALGMPWETCSHEEILDLTGGKGVVALQDMPAGHARKLADTRGIAVGETTDDWQLTSAVARSLIRSRGFHLFDLAATHIEAFETLTKGWGGGTRAAMREMQRWFDTRGREGRRPDVPASPKPGYGKGNGVLMKLSPLACHAALDLASAEAASRADRSAFLPLDPRAELRLRVTLLGRMSHDEEYSPDVASVLFSLLTDPGPCTPEFVLSRIENESLTGTLRPLYFSPGSAGHESRREPTATETRLACRTTFLASESAAFALATLLRHPDDFAAAVLEAINGGGDTDTNASITGALVGARVGLQGIPTAWISAVPDAARALATADELIATFS